MQSAQECLEVSQPKHESRLDGRLTVKGEACIDPNSNQNEVVLSKNQAKKLVRRQKSLETRKDRRKAEREKKKLKKRELAKQREEDGLPTPEPKKYTLMADSSNKFRVVIDMDFEDYMTEDEMSKAAKQVGRIYAINRHCASPCQLYVTSLKGKIRDRFSTTNSGYRNWDIHVSEQDYMDLFSCDKLDKSDEEVDSIKENIVYLSGDADETLPSVDDLLGNERRIFVIGGLVDHNRHKDLCRKRAIERKIRTAKLPIKEHIQLCQRHIFSTFTVFEIMLNVLAMRKQWSEALTASIPKRKIASIVSKNESVGEVQDTNDKQANTTCLQNEQVVQT